MTELLVKLVLTAIAVVLMIQALQLDALWAVLLLITIEIGLAILHNN